MKQAFAAVMVMMLTVFSSAAFAAPGYYYGENHASADYLSSIDPLIGSPNYPSTTQSYTYRNYFFHRNYPTSPLSVSYQPLRSEERFPYGDVFQYDAYTGLTFNLGSKGTRPFDYRYNNGLAVLSARNGAGAGTIAAQTAYMSAPTQLAPPITQTPKYSPQYLDGLAYPSAPAIDFDTYARGAAYR